MSQLITSNKYFVVVGAGVTGQSLVRYLLAQKERCIVFDTRRDEYLREKITDINSQVQVYLGHMPEDVFLDAEEIFISPGVSLAEAFLEPAKKSGVLISGDVDLFLRHNTSPVVGITGSNGKTTVTTMLSQALSLSGLNVATGGNIGTPALDLLSQEADVIVLELSSFQLETIRQAKLEVACILNVSADHMDRYDSMHQYFSAKQRIYFGAKNVVYNLDDTLTIPPLVNTVKRFGFTSYPKVEEQEIRYFFDQKAQKIYRNKEELFNRSDIRLPGTHNVQNVLAVLAICECFSVEHETVCQFVKEFSGLEHRCEPVENKGSVCFINDSKATNIGATISAVLSLYGEYQNIVLIVGGEGKGANFNELADTISDLVSAIVVLGRDGHLISAAMPNSISCVEANDINDAVQKAYSIAVSINGKSLVLLSPACASFDMFMGYEDRGRQFKDAVESLVA